MEKRKLVLSLILFISIIVVGTFTYTYVEGWNLLNSLYFVVITVTTIGYGDFVPVTNMGKLLTIVLAFFGVSMALYFLSLIGSKIFKKHVEEQVSQIKEGIKKEEEVKKELDETIKENIKKPIKKKK